MKKGLGRGLDSIFADNYIDVAASSKEDGIQTLRISQIEPNLVDVTDRALALKGLNFIYHLNESKQ